MTSIDTDVDFEHLNGILEAEEISLESFDISEQPIEEESSEIFKLFKLFPTLTLENAEEVLTNICKQLYKEELFDIQSSIDNSTYNNIIDLIIKYPEVTVSNDKSTSHIMKDFYVKYRFESLRRANTAKLVLSSILGRRGVISPRELYADYQFSHLSGGVSNGWRHFCFGTSTPINSMIEKLRGSGRGNGIETQNLLKLFLLFDVYIEWQSDSGVPYRTITNIRSLKEQKEKLYNADKYVYDDVEDTPLSREIFNTLITTENFLKKFEDECISTTISGDISVDFIKLSYLIKEIIFFISLDDYVINTLGWIKLDEYTYSLYTAYFENAVNIHKIKFENAGNCFNFKNSKIKCKVEEYIEKFNVESLDTPKIDLTLDSYFPPQRLVLSVYYTILSDFITFLYNKNV